MTTIGFIGIGLMGSRMSARLLAAGYTVWIWNRSPEKCQPLLAQGAKLATNLADIARECEVIMLCLADTAAVDSVMFGDQGLSNYLCSRQLIVDFSSITPDASRDFASRLAARDVFWVDCPVSGGVMGAEKGTLILMAGGAAEQIERLRPISVHLGQKLTHMGEVGAGQITKICNQMIVASNAVLIAETVALAKQLLLVEETGVKAHFSQLSCKSSVELIRIAKDKGLPVTADVAMHQLHLTDAAIDGFNSLAHVRPPLRSEADRLALCAAVQDGTIDAICSHHQPLNAAAKLAPFPATEPGISALETVLPLGLRLVRDGLLTEDRLWRALTVNPARIAGISAGTLATGGGVIIVDPEAGWNIAPETLVSAGHNTPFVGMLVQGRVQAVLL